MRVLRRARMWSMRSGVPSLAKASRSMRWPRGAGFMALVKLVQAPSCAAVSASFCLSSACRLAKRSCILAMRCCILAGSACRGPGHGCGAGRRGSRLRQGGQAQRGQHGGGDEGVNGFHGNLPSVGEALLPQSAAGWGLVLAGHVSGPCLIGSGNVKLWKGRGKLPTANHAPGHSGRACRAPPWDHLQGEHHDLTELLCAPRPQCWGWLF